MYSVSQRINAIKQPLGGYIKPKEFTAITLDDGFELNPDESVHANIVGLAVDYLTRLMRGSPAEGAFYISQMGAEVIGEGMNAETLISQITDLDDKSIINACKVVGYDVCLRAGMMGYKPVNEIRPDTATIENVRIMVNRCLAFLKEYGPVVLDGFTFQGGYTDIVSSGDGDYLTEDTLWDVKVSKAAPTNKHTLQLLMYYLLGSHSIHKEFRDIKKLGIFNPRLNRVYQMEIANISDSVIQEVSSKVIGYK